MMYWYSSSNCVIATTQRWLSFRSEYRKVDSLGCEYTNHQIAIIPATLETRVIDICLAQLFCLHNSSFRISGEMSKRRALISKCGLTNYKKHAVRVPIQIFCTHAACALSMGICFFHRNLYAGPPSTSVMISDISMDDTWYSVSHSLTVADCFPGLRAQWFSGAQGAALCGTVLHFQQFLEYPKAPVETCLSTETTLARLGSKSCSVPVETAVPGQGCHKPTERQSRLHLETTFEQRRNLFSCGIHRSLAAIFAVSRTMHRYLAG